MWLKTKNLKHRLKIRKNKHANEGNSEQFEIIKYYDKNAVGPEATHYVLVSSKDDIIIPGTARELGESSSPQSLNYITYVDVNVKC